MDIILSHGAVAMVCHYVVRLPNTPALPASLCAEPEKD